MQLRLTLAPAMIALLVAGCATAPEQPARIDADDRQCLALAMYFEARGEGDRGMLAVGAVVLNRVASAQFPDTACAVVKQGGERPPCQFSWWCDGKSDVPRDRAQWNAALTNADRLLRSALSDPTHGALFFHSVAVSSPWSTRRRTTQIGDHVFYR